MPLAAPIAASLNVGLPTRTRALWIGGLDVLKRPGTPGNTYSVDPTTVEVVEGDAGQVSSLRATITDPAGELTLNPVDPVLFMDLANNVPIFRGFLSSPAVMPLGVGRSIDIEADGVEILLDWMKVPAMTVPSGTDSYAAVAMVVAAATGIGYSFRMNGLILGGSLQATPLDMGATTITTGYAVTFANPVTLRDALDQVARSVGAGFMSVGAQPFVGRFTVDPYLGLRSWDASGFWGFTAPADYFGPTFSQVGANPRPSGTSYQPVVGIHHAYVKGGNAAGTGLFTDGSGVPGEVVVIVDSNILSAAAAQSAASAYFAQHGGTARVTVTAEEESSAVSGPGAEVRPGAVLTITDPQAGIPSARTFTIRQVTRRYLANGKENTTFEAGAELESGAMMLRRLTRGTLS